MITGLTYRDATKLITPVGPCTIAGCAACYCGQRNCTCGGLKYVIEHCHQHDYVRGISCIRCNRQMGRIDKILRGEPCGVNLTAPVSSYIAHWLNCQKCILGDGLTKDCGCVHVSGRACGCCCVICREGKHE